MPVHLSSFLRPVFRVEDVPGDAFVFYMKDRILYCERRHFAFLSQLLTRTLNVCGNLGMDLCRAGHYSLVLDVKLTTLSGLANVIRMHNFQLDTGTFVAGILQVYMEQVMASVLADIFFPSGVMHNFTMMVVPWRSSRKGLAFHFPELTISHDDHDRLFHHLKSKLYWNLNGLLEVILVKRCNGPLPLACRCSFYGLYRPRVYYVDKLYRHGLNIFESENNSLDEINASVANLIRILVHETPDNEASFFVKMLRLPRNEVKFKLLDWLMPVVMSDAPLFRVVLRPDDATVRLESLFHVDTPQVEIQEDIKPVVDALLNLGSDIPQVGIQEDIKSVVDALLNLGSDIPQLVEKTPCR